MATDSGQKFIRRNRAPRVHITYEDPYDAERLIELPFVMGVMSDLSGNAPASKSRRSTSGSSSNSTWTISTTAWRRSSPASPCGSTTSSATKPARSCPSTCDSTRWTISRPAAVARQVPAMAKLLEAREQLANLLRYMDGKVAAEDQLKKLLADPQLMAALRERANGRRTNRRSPRRLTRIRDCATMASRSRASRRERTQVETTRSGRIRRRC